MSSTSTTSSTTTSAASTTTTTTTTVYIDDHQLDLYDYEHDDHYYLNKQFDQLLTVVQPKATIAIHVENPSGAPVYNAKVVMEHEAAFTDGHGDVTFQATRSRSIPGLR